MKTSELKRRLREDCVESFNENDDIIYGFYWRVHKQTQNLYVNGIVPLNVIKVLGEYINTPISERENEKKYYFEFGSCLDRIEKQRYLGIDLDDGVFYFDKKHTNNFNFKVVFTQSEIDNFPAEIKGAIECGFLRKVEVE